MYPYLGDFPTGQTIYCPFHTFDSNDPSASVAIAAFVLADVRVYKDGSITQRTSTNGFTLLDTDGIDFDGIVGLGGVSIDTSDDTDSGFFAAGSDYWVIIGPVTIDAAVINFIAATFSIDNRGLLRPTTVQRTLDVTATGAAGIDWGNVENPTTALDLSGTDIQLVDTATTVTNQITAATMADAIWDETMAGHTTADTSGLIMNEWQDGGRLDLILDIIAVDTTTDIPALISTAQSDLDTITGAAGAIVDSGAASVTVISDAVWNEDATGHQTQGTFGQAIGDPAADADTIYGSVVTGAAGANIAVDIIAVKAETALIVGDTNELQTDDIPGLIATAQSDLDIITGAAGAIVDSGAATVTVLSDAIWDEAQAGHVGAGTFGVIATEIAAIPTTAMRGTDNALLAASINLTGGALDVVTAVTDRVTANVDQIAGVTAAATQLSLSADTVIGLGTASGIPTTTTMVSDIGVTVDDQYNGRIIIFADSTTTAALRDQATDITACTAASNTLTFTALTTAPVSGDTFVIV